MDREVRTTDDGQSLPFVTLVVEGEAGNTQRALY